MSRLAPPVGRPPPLRRNRDFALLWFGQAASALGSQMSWVAYPLLVLTLGGSAAIAGTVAFVNTFARMLVALPAGVLVDRWDRKKIMLGCDAARCLALASLAAALWWDRLSFAQILMVAVVEGACSTLFAPAQTAALRHIVPTSQLRDALGRNQGRQYLATLVGPVVGGELFGARRLLPFLADALSYALSFFAVALLHTPLLAPQDRTVASLRLSVREGMAWLAGDRFLRTVFGYAMGLNFVSSALELLAIVVARQQGASGSAVGLMLTLAGFGGLIGALIAPPVTRRMTPGATVLAVSWVFAVLLPLFALTDDPVSLGVVLGVAFAAAPAAAIAVGAYLIGTVPDRLQGRVASTANLLSECAMALGPIGGGLLFTVVGWRPAVFVLAAVTLVVAVGMSCSHSLRLPVPVGETAPGAVSHAQCIPTL